MPPKGEKRKQQIVDTAKEMFMEKGFQSTHIGQVCARLNIARGTVYQYFSNKKEILYAVLDNVIEKIEDIFDIDDFNDFFTTTPDENEVLQFVSERISSSIQVLINEPIVIKLIFKEITGIDSEVNKRVVRSVSTIEKIIAHETEELSIKGIFKANLNYSITASMIVGGIMLLVDEYISSGRNILDKKVIEAITSNYLHGVLL